MVGAVAAQQRDDLPRFERRLTELRGWLAAPVTAPAPWDEPHRVVRWLHEQAITQLAESASRIDVPAMHAVVRDLHLVLERVPECAPIFVEWEVWYLTTLALTAQFSLGLRFVDEVALVAIDDGAARARLFAQKSQFLRRLFRWSEALRAAEAARQVPNLPTQVRGEVLLVRANLALELGRVEIAAGLARELRELIPSDRASELCADATLLELRLDGMLHRAAEAARRVAEFERLPVAPKLAADPSWAPRLAELQVRAAMAVFTDPRRRGQEVEQAIGWVRAAIALPALGTDERALARLVLANHSIDVGDWAAATKALADLQVATASGAGASLDDRRLTWAALQVRLLLAQGKGGSELEIAVDALAAMLDALLARWGEVELGHDGFGPLCFEDRRLAVAELARARLRLDPSPGGAERVLNELLRVQACGSLSRALAAPAVDVPTLRRTLVTKDSAALLYVPGRSSMLVIAVDSETVEVEEVALGIFELEELRNQLIAAVLRRRSGATTEVRESARRLSSHLLPPAIASRIDRCRSICVVGSSVLGYVPFEILTDEHGAMLGCRCAVRYLPSASVGMALRERQQHWTKAMPSVRLLACPNAPPPPESTEQFESLPFGRAEEGRLARSLTGTHPQVFAGLEALRERISTAELADVDALQILTHGVRDDGRIDTNGLLMGDGSVLWPADVERLRLPSLVVYAACRAGRGRIRVGDDGRHLLAGASLLAGAQAVVLPFLDVDYRATLDFSAALHRLLWQEQLPLGEAMRRVRVELAQSTPGSLEPMLFHVIGVDDWPMRTPTTHAPRLQVPAAAVGRQAWLPWLALLLGLPLLAGALVLVGVRRRQV